jgi:hypothetical protein
MANAMALIYHFLVKATRANQSRARLFPLTCALIRRSRDDRPVLAGNEYPPMISPKDKPTLAKAKPKGKQRAEGKKNYNV